MNKDTAYQNRRANRIIIQDLQHRIQQAELVQDCICKINPYWHGDEKLKIHYHTTVEIIAMWGSVQSGDMISIHGVTQYWDELNRLVRIYL